MTTQFIQLGAHAILTCRELSSLPLETVAGVPAMVLESVGPIHHAVNVPFHDSQARGKAILIRTGWDGLRGTAEFEQPGPYLHDELIFRLIRARVRLVGLDFGDAAAGNALIEQNIPIVQHLSNLASIPKWGARFYAVGSCQPGNSVPVRAFVEISSSESA